MAGISKINQTINLYRQNSINFTRRFKNKRKKSSKIQQPIELEPTRNVTKEYDSNKKLIKETIEEGEGYKTINEYRYGLNGNIKGRTTTRIFEYGNAVIDNFIYDENGNIASRQTQFPAIQSVGTIDSSLLGKNITMEYNGTYDENGMCNSCKYKVIGKDGQEIKLPSWPYMSY